MATNAGSPLPISFLDDMDFVAGGWDVAILAKTIETNEGVAAYNRFKELSYNTVCDVAFCKKA